MTTRIHIVNFGPDYVEAQPKTPIGTATATPTKLGPQQSADFYVYDSQEVLVKEIPSAK